MKRRPKAKPHTWFLAAFLSLALMLSCQNSSSTKAVWKQVPEILKTIKVPDFSEQDFLVTDFGAVGDGQTDNTDAFARAIEVCAQAGGGRVVVPAGEFLTGAIHLKSQVNLHVSKNATLLFFTDPEKYLPVVYTRFEGSECYNYSALIYAFEQENIAVTGSGTLDGQASITAWWPWKGRLEYGWQEGQPRQQPDVDVLVQMAETGVPVKDRIFGAGHFLRPNFIQFYRCKNVLIDSVTIKRSPMWEVHPVLCENVTVQNITVSTHGPNNDGCNPESSKNVHIKNCFFDTGDDCIAIKSGRNADGRCINVPSENIVIQNCTMRDGHGGVVIGSEMSGGCRNVFAEDCVMDSPNLERALRIKTNSVRGGYVENIYMRNIKVGEVSDAVVRIFFHYQEGDVGEFTPVVRNVYVENVSSQKSKYGLLLDGYERSPITNVNVINCSFDNVADGNIMNYVENLTVKNFTINGELQTAEILISKE